MIYFIVPSHQQHVFESITFRLKNQPFQDVSIIPLPELCRTRSLPRSTYVFAGFQVADDAGRRVAAQVWASLEEAGGSRLLNHPMRFLRRHELLLTLHEKGVNGFRSFRAEELADSDPRYPVFVRHEHRHTGNLTELIWNRDELHAELSRLHREGIRGDLLVVEYVDVSDDQGIFRKACVVKVGERIMPENLSYSGHWMVKRYPQGIDASPSNPLTRRLLDEEARFIRERPGMDALNEIFRTANVDFGRVDYTFHDGNIHAWEINTGPYWGSASTVSRTDWMLELRELRQPTKDAFNREFAEALAAIDSSPDAPGRIPVDIDPETAEKALAYDQAVYRRYRRSRRRAAIRTRLEVLPGFGKLLELKRRYRIGTTGGSA